MARESPGRFWIIRHPARGGPKKTVAQFDTKGGTVIPDEIAEYEEFQIQRISGRSALVDDIDQSGLSEEERQLLSQIYPVREQL